MKRFLAALAAAFLPWTGLFAAAGDGLPRLTNDWFAVTFAGRAVGETLSDAGATGGSWGAVVPPAGMVATNALEEARHYLSYNTVLGNGDLDFTASAACAGLAQTTDFAIRFAETESAFEPEPDDRAALSMIRDAAGTVTFLAYGASGWVPVSSPFASAAFGTWYDCRVTLENVGGVLFATYAVKGADRYETLRDAEGCARFPAAGAGLAWTRFALRGAGDAGDFSAKDISADAAHTFYWIGGAAGAFADGANWSHTAGGAAAGAVPGAADTAVVATKDAVLTLAADAALAGLRLERDATFAGAALAAKAFSGAGILSVSNATLALSFGAHVDKLALAEGAAVRLDMTDALMGRAALRVDLCDGDILSALTLANVPAEYTCTTNANLAGGVILVNGEKDFQWLLGAGVAGNWSDPANWGVGQEIATRPPAALDRVIFPEGASVVVDRDAAALAVVAKGALTMTGVATLESFDFCVSNAVTLTGNLFTPYVNLTMTPSGTLSLGGTTNLVVRHFSGAGTVTDGVLRTGDGCYYQNGGSLTLPCVDGSSYRLWRKGYALTLAGSTEDDAVEVLVPPAWFTDRQGARRALYCRGDVAWDVRGRTAGEPYRATEEWLAGWWNIPADPDAQEAYIEGDGTMAINTGWFAAPDAVIVADFQFVTTQRQQRVFGAASASDASVGLSTTLYITGGDFFGFTFRNGSVDSWSWITNATLARVTATIDARKPTVTATLVSTNGLHATKNSGYAHTARANWPLALFANCVGPEGTNFTNFARMRLYSFRVYEGENLVRYYLPCREGTKIGLKEIFTQRFFTNVTSEASFIAGGDVSEVPAWDETLLDGYRIENGVITGVRVRADVADAGHGLVSLAGGAPATSGEVCVSLGATTVVTAIPNADRGFSRWTGDTDAITNGAFALNAEITPLRPVEIRAWFGLRNRKDESDPYAHGYLDRFYRKPDGTWEGLWTDGCWTEYHNATQQGEIEYGLHPTWWKDGYYPTNENDRIHFQCQEAPDYYFNSWIDWPSGRQRFGIIADASRRSLFNIRGEFSSSLHIARQDAIYAIWQQESDDSGGGFLVDAENSPHRINRVFASKVMSFDVAGETSEAILGETTGSGTLRKVGTGRLTLETAYRGGVRLQNGEISIGRKAHPDALVAGAFSHFDASLTNTMTFALAQDGQMRLSKWTDADGGTCSLKGGRYTVQTGWTNSWAGPVLGSRTVKGVRLVDFGAYTYGSANGGGTFVDDSVTPGERALFGPGTMMDCSAYVSGAAAGSGGLASIFMIYEHPSKTGYTTPINWWQESPNGFGSGAIMANGAGALAGSDVTVQFTSRVRENDCPLKGDRAQILDYRDGYDFTVLSAVSEARTFGWWHVGSHQGTRNAGGVRIAEILAYERILTPDEQEQNSLYLQRKWHDRETNDVYPWTLGHLYVMPDEDGEARVHVGPGKTASIRTLHRPAWTEFEGKPLVKTGAGTLELDRVQNRVDIAVRGGKVKFVRQTAKIAEDPKPAPHPYFWGDATRTDRFVFAKDADGNDTAEIMSWLDCRTTCDIAMTNWVVTTPNPSSGLLPYKSPKLLATGGLHGLPTVDFGASFEKYGARLGLNSTTNKTDGIGRAYVAEMTDAFIVWRNIAPPAVEGSSSVPYIFAETVQDAWRRHAGSLANAFDAGAYHMRFPGSSTWTVDGLLTHPSREFPDTTGRDDYVVIRIHSPGRSYINQIGGNWGVYSPNDYRALGGGVQIAEVIVYQYALSDFQARQTEAYLMKKWKGAAHPDTGTGAAEDVGDVAFAPGIPGELDLESDRRFGIVSGSGTFTKRGAGKATIESLVGFDNVVLTGGTVVVEGDYTAPATLEVTLLEDGTLLGAIEASGKVTVPDDGTLILRYAGENAPPRGSYRLISGSSVTGGRGWTIACDHPRFESNASKVRALETSFNLEIGGKGFMIFLR